MTDAPILLLTRPEPASRLFLRALLAAGHGPVAPILSPLIGVTVTGPLPRLTGLRGLVFTSAQAVAAYAQLGGPTMLPAFAVGDATARACAETGLAARSAGGDAEALVAWLASERPAAPLLHLRGTHSRGAVAPRLTAIGLPTFEAVIYDQPLLPPTPAAREALNGARPVVAPVFSPRTAEALSALPKKAPLLVAAMSEAVAKACAPLHSHSVAQAAHPDLGAMVAVTGDLLAEARKLETARGRV